MWQNIFRLLGTSIDRNELTEKAEDIIVFINRIVFAALSPHTLGEMLNSEPKPRDEALMLLLKKHGVEEPLDTGLWEFDKQIAQLQSVLMISNSKEQFEEFYRRVFGEKA